MLTAMPADTSRRTALVTGPTAGIGEAFARRLAADGYDVVLVARNRERLESLAAELERAYGVAAEVLVADLADRSALATVEARVSDPARPVDLLVNNAGFGHKRPFLDNTVEDEQQMLDVLVTAVLRLTHAALGPMSQRGHGGIINVSSVAAFLPRGTYAAAKSWVNSFSEWAANEYRPQGVTVTCLCPGFTKTEFHERMKVKRGDGLLWLDADKLVSTALADFDKGKVFSIPSAQYKAIVTLSRLIPNRALQTYQSIGRR
jgi:uncharacterized protein